MLSKQSPDGGTVGAVGRSSVAGIVSTPPGQKHTSNDRYLVERGG